MDGRILQLTKIQVTMLRRSLESGNVPYGELGRADKILDKLYVEGDIDDSPVSVALTVDEYSWVLDKWRGTKDFLLHRETRKLVLNISDALCEAPGFTLKASESGVTVERERDTNSEPVEHT